MAQAGGQCGQTGRLFAGFGAPDARPQGTIEVLQLGLTHLFGRPVWDGDRRLRLAAKGFEFFRRQQAALKEKTRQVMQILLLNVGAKTR